jgi:quercetin dioxygenase-like cupin family protein
MNEKKDKLLDEFLETLVSDEPDALDVLAVVADGLIPVVPRTNLRSALMTTLPTSRFERFTQQVGALLDIDHGQALTLLNGIDDVNSWEAGLMPGMALYHVEGGPAVERAITGFIRLESAQCFPPHTHLGDESVMVLQGYYVDDVSGREYGPGDIARLPAGSSHSFSVLAKSTGLLYLAVVQEGLQIGDDVLLFDDPNM